MKFSCDRCHKRFSTADEPVPGRVYRVPCKCGNTIVVQLQAAAERAAPAASPPAPPRRAAPPPLPAAAPPPIAAAAPASGPAVDARWVAAEAAAIVDDPFARPQEQPGLGVLLACASEEVTPTVLGTALALRDPDAPEVSTLYDPDPADPFAEELRRTRTHALALGGAAGAVVGGACAAILTVLLLRPWSSAEAAPGVVGDPIVAQLAPIPERPAAGRRPPVRTAALDPAIASSRGAPIARAPAPVPEPQARRAAAAAPARDEAGAPARERLGTTEEVEPHGAPRIEPVVEERTPTAAAAAEPDAEPPAPDPAATRDPAATAPTDRDGPAAEESPASAEAARAQSTDSPPAASPEPP